MNTKVRIPTDRKLPGTDPSGWWAEWDLNLGSLDFKSDPTNNFAVLLSSDT